MAHENTIQPFEKGDVLVACTLLNNDDDDHAGDGRIFQYDADLNEKGVLWTKHTTHLVNGLKFGPDGTLWAFDQHVHAVLNIDPKTGEETLVDGLVSRSLSNINFMKDGSRLFGEHLNSAENLPGTHAKAINDSGAIGEGKVFKYDPAGKLVGEYKPEVHGGMARFLGVTSALLLPDDRTLLYLTETSNEVRRYDVVDDKQLSPLATYPEGREGFVFFLATMPDGRLMLTRGGHIEFLNPETGAIEKEVPQEGFGWAVICGALDNVHAYSGNFFSGEIAKFNTETGEKVASVNLGVARALAGVAQYPG
ncbi:MAG: hypothetical protein HN793_10090 [Rhodospirillaceae bacterium]|jgi:outer membrane protein assembly factor BamB|nr:hypothetical protein [Rhodospirillaceae bacterium]MBT5241303.1 hypothetical protein [Rhodospirillaceae bacterium]MBT5565062.1 hypothetical protein [Rhodospirillaceae bacterium]MBT6088084.1 hypothetical protein [Rhodospirillaceae bacterium]MBT6961697.1 hypothetical protein [Rhodospirillaceae bacterium]